MTTFQYLCLRLAMLLDRLPKRKKPQPPAPQFITGTIYVSPDAEAAALARHIAERASDMQPRHGRGY